jgi:hypothetical protein
MYWDIHPSLLTLSIRRSVAAHLDTPPKAERRTAPPEASNRLQLASEIKAKAATDPNETAATDETPALRLLLCRWHEHHERIRAFPALRGMHGAGAL